MARKGRIEIDQELCKGCYLCVRACPADALEAGAAPNSTGSVPAVFARPERCVVCAGCYEVCPDLAIRVFAEEQG
ncbi:MAG: 4Fe-4S binding protein [Spirochaetaceae bacterium]|jgi:2-oxoglutarate ferredoxin oxidoreductase subunit delta|nr:4Fe-4S binding protein [Spirochaetaceae bacterium]